MKKILAYSMPNNLLDEKIKSDFKSTFYWATDTETCKNIHIRWFTKSAFMLPFYVQQFWLNDVYVFIYCCWHILNSQKYWPVRVVFGKLNGNNLDI